MALSDPKSWKTENVLGSPLSAGRGMSGPSGRGGPLRSLRSLGMQLLLILWGVEDSRAAAPRVLIES